MASAFSLGAAIGATGKFPKIKQPEQDTAAQDRVARELTAIRQGLTVDKNKYHNAYINQAADDQNKAIFDLMDAERNKSPERVSLAYNIDGELQRKRNFLQVLSKDLFDIEEDAEVGDQKGLYVPKYFQDLRAITKSAKSEDDLFKRLQENPEFFKDGYLKITVDEKGLRRIVPTLNKKYDFERILSGKDVFNLSQHGVLIKEEKTLTDKERTIERYISVPMNKEEAMELQKTDPTVKPENNAYDLGKKWFLSNPKAQQQYKSMMYETGRLVDGDPAETNPEELYKEFYKDYVVNNIPAKYENKDALVPRYITNINVDTAQKVAPTSFTVGPSASNFKGDLTDELYTESAIAPSSDPQGVEVELPQNRYAISLSTGAPEFTGTAMKKYNIARIGLYPCVKAKDQQTGKVVLVPLSKKQKQSYDSAGKKYMMLPFALAVAKPLQIGVMPDISKATYALPLYEPNEKGEWVIDAETRKAKNGKGSPTLSQIIQRNKWDEQSLNNWTTSYFGVMEGVVDENDLKTKK